jgi:hypothetical protein
MANRFGQQQQRAEPAAVLTTRPVRVPDQKYTIFLSQSLRQSIDEDVDRLRRDSATKVGRSDVIRSLIRQLHADESLYDTVLTDLITRANADT